MKTLSQTDRIYNLLMDHKPHRTDEIQIKIYGANHLGTARISGRVSDIRRIYNIKVEGWKDKNIKSLFWYQIPNPEPQQNQLFNLGATTN